MRTSFIKAIFLSLLSSIYLQVHGQSSLDAYINEGLQKNFGVQQKDLMLQKAQLSTKIAKGMFVPSVGFIANYTTGDGGRSINFPIGDLLNPVYAALGQSTRVENVNQNFFPRDFYDVRVRTSMPLFNTDLLYNKRIQTQQSELQAFETQVYKRELVRNIKIAYYNYLSALEGERIYESALTRALESKRVNESLLANGKGLPAYLLRSQSEIESINAQKNEASQQVLNAQLYFNYLLNREANTSIDINFNPAEAIAEVEALNNQPAEITQREELKQLEKGTEINNSVLLMKKNFWAPKLNGFVDVGAQAENLKYNNDANYYLLGLQLDIPLFAGYTNRNKIAQAKIDVENVTLQKNLVSQQLNMASSVARNNLIAAYQNYTAAQKQVEAAQSYQRLIEKGYKEGVGTFIETVDARNQLTSAQLLAVINQYRVLIAAANLERELATYTFN